MIYIELFWYKFIFLWKKLDKLMIVLYGCGDSIWFFYFFDDEFNIFEMNYLLLNVFCKFLDGYIWYGEFFY